MPTDFEELKQRLLRTDEQFRQLATQHHELDERIHTLATRHYLSEPEHLEEVTLKKRKLHAAKFTSFGSGPERAPGTAASGPYRFNASLLR